MAKCIAVALKMTDVKGLKAKIPDPAAATKFESNLKKILGFFEEGSHNTGNTAQAKVWDDNGAYSVECVQNGKSVAKIKLN